VDAVNKLSSGEVDMASLKAMSYSDAKKELLKIKGIGPKVADCILLFSLGKSEAFPIDVWVQRTMRTLYLGENATNKQIETEAERLFGKYAGFAQQYLFYYARENGGFSK
jgi:N-glycosylase/DNA lyase